MLFVGVFFFVLNIANASWWEHAIFYQIYPRSFKDSSNNGIGDLKGILTKIDYFTETGIDCIWLSPIFKSPQIDQGYDISDYRTVDPDYGTNADLEELIKAVHKAGIKIILDFVPNHTSDQAQWFKDSIAKKAPYTDFYVWVDGKKDKNGVLHPPNNWMSMFGGSAWTYNKERNQYYLHQFSKQQPDLNFQNPHVLKEMTDILEFWLDKGVDGFRVDAVPYLIEDSKLIDEPLLDPNNTKIEWNTLDHIYTKDQQKTYDIIYEWRTFIDSYTKKNGGDDRILVTETYTTIDKTMLYFGTPNGTKLGAHFTFNFCLITDVNCNSTATDISNVINRWLKKIPKIYTSNWVLGNHDNPRVATRLGPNNVDGFNMLMAVLPGIGVTYNGEEIGQQNGKVDFHDRQDPSANDPETFTRISRDFERTPFQWDDTVNGGFNYGAKPWLPSSQNFIINNLALQKNKKISHYKIYQKLMKLRKEAPLRDGNVQVLSVGYVLLVKRCYKKDCMVLLFNKTDKKQIVDVKKWVPDINKVILKSEQSEREESYSVVPSNLMMDENEAVIVRF